MKEFNDRFSDLMSGSGDDMMNSIKENYKAEIEEEIRKSIKIEEIRSESSKRKSLNRSPQLASDDAVEALVRGSRELAASMGIEGSL